MAASEPAFAAALSAVRDGRPVPSPTAPPGEPAAEERRVEPWGVVSWHGRWYLVGHDTGRGADAGLPAVAGSTGAGARRPGRLGHVPDGHGPARVRGAATAGDRVARPPGVRVRAGTCWALRGRPHVRTAGRRRLGRRSSSGTPTRSGWPTGSPASARTPSCWRRPEARDAVVRRLRAAAAAGAGVTAPARPARGPAAPAAGARALPAGPARGAGQRGGRGLRRDRGPAAQGPRPAVGVRAARATARATSSTSSSRATPITLLEPAGRDPAAAAHRRRGAGAGRRAAGAGRHARAGRAGRARPGAGQGRAGRRRGGAAGRPGRGGGRGRRARAARSSSARWRDGPPAAPALLRARPRRDHRARRRPDAPGLGRGPALPRGLVPRGPRGCGCSAWTGSLPSTVLDLPAEPPAGRPVARPVAGRVPARPGRRARRARAAARARTGWPTTTRASAVEELPGDGARGAAAHPRHRLGAAARSLRLGDRGRVVAPAELADAGPGGRPRRRSRRTTTEPRCTDRTRTRGPASLPGGSSAPGGRCRCPVCRRRRTAATERNVA